MTSLNHMDKYAPVHFNIHVIVQYLQLNEENPALQCVPSALNTVLPALLPH